jgi:hypothetical protein
VPVGNNSLFDKHFQVVSRLRDVPFYELNRPASARSASPPFKYFDWNNGNLLFDYLRYDRVPNGPGDLDNFQVYETQILFTHSILVSFCLVGISHVRRVLDESL